MWRLFKSYMIDFMRVCHQRVKLPMKRKLRFKENGFNLGESERVEVRSSMLGRSWERLLGTDVLTASAAVIFRVERTGIVRKFVLFERTLEMTKEYLPLFFSTSLSFWEIMSRSISTNCNIVVPSDLFKKTSWNFNCWFSSWKWIAPR